MKKRKNVTHEVGKQYQVPALNGRSMQTVTLHMVLHPYDYVRYPMPDGSEVVIDCKLKTSKGLVIDGTLDKLSEPDKEV